MVGGVGVVVRDLDDDAIAGFHAADSFDVGLRNATAAGVGELIADGSDFAVVVSSFEGLREIAGFAGVEKVHFVGVGGGKSFAGRDREDLAVRGLRSGGEREQNRARSVADLYFGDTRGAAVELLDDEADITRGVIGRQCNDSSKGIFAGDGFDGVSESLGGSTARDGGGDGGPLLLVIGNLDDVFEGSLFRGGGIGPPFDSGEGALLAEIENQVLGSVTVVLTFPSGAAVAIDRLERLVVQRMVAGHRVLS